MSLLGKKLVTNVYVTLMFLSATHGVFGNDARWALATPCLLNVVSFDDRSAIRPVIQSQIDLRGVQGLKNLNVEAVANYVVSTSSYRGLRTTALTNTQRLNMDYRVEGALVLPENDAVKILEQVVFTPLDSQVKEGIIGFIAAELGYGEYGKQILRNRAYSRTDVMDIIRNCLSDVEKLLLVEKVIDASKNWQMQVNEHAVLSKEAILQAQALAPAVNAELAVALGRLRALHNPDGFDTAKAQAKHNAQYSRIKQGIFGFLAAALFTWLSYEVGSAGYYLTELNCLLSVAMLGLYSSTAWYSWYKEDAPEACYYPDLSHLFPETPWQTANNN